MLCYCLSLLLFQNVVGNNIPISLEFSIGTGTSAYPSEGAWNEDDKGPSVWDTMAHTHPELMANRSTGDVASDAYHLYEQDVENAARMWLQHYRFSISWSRLLPYGTPDYINPYAVEYYFRLVDKIRSYQMDPIAVMYEWDLPQPLEDIGGWLNPDIVDHFVNYARVLLDLFGLKILYWITIDDPTRTCVTTYELDRGAPPVVRSPGIGCYLCGRHVLLAHAKTFRMRKKEFNTQTSAIGFGVTASWAEPKSNTTQEDLDAAERELQMTLGWWANPIFSYDLDYPAIMKSRIDQLSSAEGFLESRLPKFTEEELGIMERAFDFLNINYFNSYVVSSANFSDTDDPPSYEKDKGTVREVNPEWGPTGYPQGLRKLLEYIRTAYYTPRMLVAAGYRDQSEDLNDEIRAEFITQYLRQTVLASSDKIGFTAWSMIDQMEWRDGYQYRTGLFHVDFNNPNRTRTEKKSAEELRHIAGTRLISDSDE